MKNEKRPLIVVIVVFAILLVVALGYIIFQNYNESTDVNSSEQNKEVALVEGNIFDLNNVSCVSEDSFCAKEVKVAYNNENHDVKVKSELLKDSTGNYYNIKYNLYIDNELIDTLDGGLKEVSSVQNTNLGFDSIIYVFDGKYIGMLREVVSSENTSSYKLTLYNGKEKIEDEVIVKISGQGLCYDNECKQEIDVVNEISFDGTAFKFYQGDCDSGKIVLYSLTTDGTKIKRMIDKELDVNYKEAGSGALGCFSCSENKISY